MVRSLCLTAALVGTLTAGDKIAVVVNDDLKPLIQNQLNDYIDDMQADGYSTVVKTWDLAANGQKTPADLKAWLKSQSNLKGAVFIGDLPVAYFENSSDFFGKKATYPSDLFFMDLDHTWTDADKDGKYDGTGSSSTTIKIWVSRIKASNMPAYSGSESSLVKNYFAKVHRFRTGDLRLTDRALQWSDTDWKSNTPSTLSLDDAYTSVLRVTEAVSGVTTDTPDYLSRFGTSYETEHFMVHSSSKHHGSGNGKVTADTYADNTVKRLFFNAWACSGGLFTAKNCVANARTFMPTYGLLTVATTKTGAMWPYSNFYNRLGQGQSHGQAFVSYVASHPLTTTSSDYFIWRHGMVLLGDGTLRLGRHQDEIPSGSANN
jgi:hypothetical protein